MERIEIDFEVFKALTARRASASVSYNDVLRELLRLPPPLRPGSAGSGAGSPAGPKAHGADSRSRPWVSKNVSFPHGTKFRARYKGRVYEASVLDGALILNGRSFGSPSAAAFSITGNPVNGWIFWECQLPGKTDWRSISTMRTDSE